MAKEDISWAKDVLDEEMDSIPLLEDHDKGACDAALYKFGLGFRRLELETGELLGVDTDAYPEFVLLCQQIKRESRNAWGLLFYSGAANAAFLTAGITANILRCVGAIEGMLVGAAGSLFVNHILDEKAVQKADEKSQNARLRLREKKQKIAEILKSTEDLRFIQTAIDEFGIRGFQDLRDRCIKK